MSTLNIADKSLLDQEVSLQELKLENLINKYRIFIISFLILTDYILMIVVDRLDSFNFAEEIVGLLLVYSLLIYIHRITKKDKKRPILKYLTILLDFLIVLGCFYEGRDIIIETTKITIEQYVLLITTLIIITNLFSALRIQLVVIIFSTFIGLLLNYSLLDYYNAKPIVIMYTSMLIALSGFFCQYVSTYINGFFISNLKLENALSDLKNAMKEINSKNIELKDKNKELKKQHEEISHQKLQITNSITYASRIQKAILTSKEEISQVIKNCFVLFKPKDIVSGDFYWFKNIQIKGVDYKLFAVVDCTGHGVPGAFMSMLGTTLLNEITSEMNEDLSIEKVLNRLRKEVKRQLRQENSNTRVKDGMDIALCALNMQNMEVQYAGANIPIYILKNKQNLSLEDITEIKPDRMPIGVYIKEKTSFSKQIIKVEKGDVIYMFSDGYVDQFGGEKGDKYKKNRLKELLISISHLPLINQKEILERTLLEWKGTKYPQIDDITFIGVEI